MRTSDHEYDILIKNGFIVDGSGAPYLKGDVGIKDGRIVRIGLDLGRHAAKVIDAKGLVVAPGFIDIHSHADLTILAVPHADSTVSQGVTTAVGGNCGLSMAPLNPKTSALLKEYLSPFLVPGYDYGWDWRTLGDFHRKLEERKIAINLALLVGHGTLRIAVKGFDPSPLTKEEMDEMKALLRQSILDGAWGLSTGLIYPPGSYASTGEIIELTKVLKEFPVRLTYLSHIRNEGKYLIEAVEEAIEIGEKAGVPVQISHHKASGRSNWGKTSATLRLMERARSRGVEVSCDVYPYIAGSTTIMSLLPNWVLEGGVEKALERLKDPEMRRRIKEEVEEDRVKGENWIKGCGWEGIYVSSCPVAPEYEGKSLKEILSGHSDLYEGLFDWLIKIGGKASMILFFGDEEDMETVLRHPLSCVGSDSWTTSPKVGGRPHPRAYGTFPRVLGRYVREKKVLSLEEAVMKMTLIPASKLGLWDRGLVREGFKADIVVFDPNTITDNATYTDPHQRPSGIRYVIVNGEVVVEEGGLTGKLPGRVLKPHAF